MGFALARRSIAVRDDRRPAIRAEIGESLIVFINTDI
jgi:hypothetical protein